MLCLAGAALAPGDHAVVVWPAYQSLYEAARGAGAEVGLVELRHEEGWALDLDAVRAAVRPRTRAIVVNFPHNPTGAHLSRRQLEELVEIAEDAGAHLVCDEVYRWLEHEPGGLLPTGAESSPRGVSIGVMSKTLALPGIRIGWVATRDRALLRRLAELKDYTTICNGAPSEVLALIALRRLGDVIARTRAIVDPNLALLRDAFGRVGETLEWVPPRAGSTCFPRLADGTPAADFARDLLAAEGVLLLPGSRLRPPRRASAPGVRPAQHARGARPPRAVHGLAAGPSRRSMSSSTGIATSVSKLALPRAASSTVMRAIVRSSGASTTLRKS